MSLWGAGGGDPGDPRWAQKWEACSRSESLIWRWELGGKGVCVTPASLESCVRPVESKRATRKANLKGTQISVSKYHPH